MKLNYFAIGLCMALFTETYAQQNTTAADKYIRNPYGSDGGGSLVTEISNHVGSMVNTGNLNNLKNQSNKAYNTIYQRGHVVLLDGSRIEGEIAIGGRCLSDIYFINVRNVLGYDKAGKKGTIDSQWPFTVGKFSIKSFGLTNTSQSESEDTAYQWIYPYEGGRTYGEALSAQQRAELPPIDSAHITSFAARFFNNAKKGFYHHEILSFSMKPGYVRLKDGSQYRGFLKLNKMDGVVVDIVLYKRYISAEAKGIFDYKGNKSNKQVFDVNQVAAYGLISSSNGPVNETPSAFKWALNLGNSKEVNSKKADGYVLMQSGERKEGEIKLRIVDEALTSISFKGPEDKKWEDLSMPLIASFGVSGAPIDNSLNTTENFFQWRRTMTPNTQTEEAGDMIATPGAWETIEQMGYVQPIEGERMEGRLMLYRKWGYIEKIKVNPKGSKAGKFAPEEVLSYGLIEDERVKWHPEDLRVDAYRAINREPITVKGLVVSSDPKVIRRYYDNNTLQSEYKAAYVKTAEGDYLLGELREWANFSGAIDENAETADVFDRMSPGESKWLVSLNFREFDGKSFDLVNVTGKTMKQKYTEFGYFETPTISEYPMSLYTNKREGYVTFIDGTTIHGKIRIKYPESGIIHSVAMSSDGCTQVAGEEVFTGRKADKTVKVTNSYLYKDMFYVKIKNDQDKFKDIRNDMILRMGLDDVLLNELNRQDEMLLQDEKLNFHPGSIETLDGQKLTGKVAYIEGSELGKYYGVYFATFQEKPVTVYRMSELKSVNQETFDDIAEFDPFGDAVDMAEMSSTANVTPNGVVVYTDGTEKRGRISLTKSKKLWYAYSMKFTDEKGSVEIFDQNNLFKEAIVDGPDGKIKYVPYAGVISEVILESTPYMYFRNPFPTVETGFSKLLNQALGEAQSAMMENAQKEINKEIAASNMPIENKVEMMQATTDITVNAPPILDVKGFKKEYVVYDSQLQKGYITLKGDVGPYIADLDDLKLGCIDYLNMKRGMRKEVGKIGDHETGEGLQSQLDFLRKCYYGE
ncbi:MAG: hypothetical protein RIE58_05865 [Vicingaceae bacterium]